MTASLFTGGSPPRDNSGARFEAELRLTVWSDGILAFNNDTYSWCRSLDSASLASVKEALAPLVQESAELPKEHTELLLGGETVVSVDRQDPLAPGTSLDRVAFWSPSLENADAVAKSLDEVFCTLETSLGSGYRYQVTKHFSEFLAARGREVPCEKRGAWKAHPSPK